MLLEVEGYDTDINLVLNEVSLLSVAYNSSGQQNRTKQVTTTQTKNRKQSLNPIVHVEISHCFPSPKTITS